MNVREVGAYIRDQRKSAELSLKKLSGLAGISIPYLSQVERGLRRPSADILQAIAKALRISAGTLYVRAGILEENPVADAVSAIMGDPGITERQKQALIQIYEAFRGEAGRDLKPVASQAATAWGGSVPAPSGAFRATSGRKGAAGRSAASGSGTTVGHATRSPRTREKRVAGTTGGGTKSKAGDSPYPAPLRPPVTNRRKEV